MKLTDEDIRRIIVFDDPVDREVARELAIEVDHLRAIIRDMQPVIIDNDFGKDAQ